ncbi:RluA family pseudouridine synthase [Alteribacter populi]|uniref:RluA family pseudouridine synthase n=1 Tax=Alteribacter populi TaxID=2011011 RepID=UPI000BBAB9E9|nr:RluA family pseudouridine synthase [Alteribacter populi]
MKNLRNLSITWEIPPSLSGKVLREFLRDEKQMSRKTLAEIKYKGGALLVNDREETVRALVKPGDKITVVFPPEQVSPLLTGKTYPFSIVAEDDHMMVVHKPAGLPTVPSKERPGYSLAHAVIGYYECEGVPSTFHAVNRLDKDTSGLMIVAKHRYAHDLFVKAQQKGNLVREYQALVSGQLEKKEGTIDAAIGRKESSIIERIVSPGGQPAITHYQALAESRNASLVHVQLETGRTHQIRVHFASINHPLLGDTLYGGNSSTISRHALHSWKLTFEHPLTGKMHTYVEKLPQDMEAAWLRESEA